MLDSVGKLFTGGTSPLIIGVIVGLGILLFLRGRQVWRHRGAFGYDVYTADTLRKRLSRWAAGVIVIGVLAAGYYFLPRQSATPAQSIPAEDFTIDQQPTGAEDILSEMKLVIPQLGLELKLLEAPFVAQQWDISRLTHEAAHLAGTAYPGQPGNAVLAGHITIPGQGWGPFRELDTLLMGEYIFIEDGQEVYTYEVFDNRLVDATAIDVVFPTEQDQLTLITCSGWDDEQEEYTKRVVVVARRIP